MTIDIMDSINHKTFALVKLPHGSITLKKLSTTFHQSADAFPHFGTYKMRQHNPTLQRKATAYAQQIIDI